MFFKEFSVSLDSRPFRHRFGTHLFILLSLRALHSRDGEIYEEFSFHEISL